MPGGQICMAQRASRPTGKRQINLAEGHGLSDRVSVKILWLEQLRLLTPGFQIYKRS